MANMWFLCMVFLITIMHLFRVKAIDCAEDMIKFRWNTLTGVIDVKTSSFHLMCNDLWVFQFNGESDS